MLSKLYEQSVSQSEPKTTAKTTCDIKPQFNLRGTSFTTTKQSRHWNKDCARHPRAVQNSMQRTSGPPVVWFRLRPYHEQTGTHVRRRGRFSSVAQLAFTRNTVSLAGNLVGSSIFPRKKRAACDGCDSDSIVSRVLPRKGAGPVVEQQAFYARRSKVVISCFHTRALGTRALWERKS